MYTCPTLYIEDWKMLCGKYFVELSGLDLSRLECFCSVCPVKGNKSNWSNPTKS